MKSIFDFDRGELSAEFLSTLNLPPFRANQVVQWIYKHRVTSFEQMTNISRPVRAMLAQHYTIDRPSIAAKQVSSDGTAKYLFQFADGQAVESVLIKQPKRTTLCVSSQVGCALGCAFCRTGTLKLKRNLSTTEIISQVLAVLDDVLLTLTPFDGSSTKEAFSNIVFMGMGEPFNNIDNVIRSVAILNDELGLNFSRRKITVSTAGVVPGIDKFGASKAKANLAVSLNATTDEVRSAIMPINKRWGLHELLNALKRYPLAPRQRITIEYVIIKDVNDSKDDANRILTILRDIPVKVNLIPFNPAPELPFNQPADDTIHFWQKYLEKNGLSATIRWSKGPEIKAACGQLAAQYTTK